MRTLYVLSHGACIRKHHNRLVVDREDAPPVEVELADLATAVILNTVQVTTQALTALLRNRVELAIIDQRGRLLGHLTPPMPKNAALRRAQYERERDPKWVLEWSRGLVAAKVNNHVAVLRQWRYNRTGDRDGLLRAEGSIQALARRIHSCRTRQELMGIEGACAAKYWRGFAAALRRSGLGFSGRRFRPPPDPVNAVLSLGYSLLTHLVASALDACGLDPWLGFFHRPAAGRPSLALDVVEVFRAPIVDRLAVRLFNLRVLKPDDFERRGSGVLLSPRALHRFAAHWEKAAGREDFEEVLQLEIAAVAAALREGVAARHWHYKTMPASRYVQSGAACVPSSSARGPGGKGTPVAGRGQITSASLAASR